MSKFNEATEKLIEGYEKIEDGVITGYKKVEDTVVGGFTKVTDRFVGTFLTRDGERVDEAKVRLAEVQRTRQEQMKADAEKREAVRNARIEAGLEASRNVDKRN